MTLPFRYLSHLVHSRRFRSLLIDAWKMGWPLIIVMLFEFLVSITDVYIAGKIGKEVQAAVGFTSQLYFVFVVMANAITVGTVSVVSRYYGAKAFSDFSESVYTVLVAAVITGIVLAGVAFIAAPFIIRLSTIPAEVSAIALPFTLIYLCALPFHYILITTNGILRATKRARRSLVTMGCVAIINIGLNLFFLYRTDLGFKGIALSTVIALVIGSLINFIPVRRMICTSCSFSRDRLLTITRIGLPTLIQQVSWQLGSLVMFFILGMLPTRSVDVMAGYTTGQRIESAIFLPAYAMNMSAAALTGNLLGSRRDKDAFYSGLISAAMCAGIIIVLSVAVILNAQGMAGLLSDNPLVIDECVRYLVIQMLAEPFMAVLVTLSGALNGAGDTVGVMRIVVGGMWIIRVPVSFLLAIHFGFGPSAVWWVMNLDIVVRMIFITRRYLRKGWITTHA